MTTVCSNLTNTRNRVRVSSVSGQPALTDASSDRHVRLFQDNRQLYATVLGRIGSFYYLSHRTMELFSERLSAETSDEELLKLVSDAHEYDEIPVRHNEDNTNRSDSGRTAGQV